MSNEYVVTEKQILTDMANTVREATGSTATYNVPELMGIAAAIVESGGSAADAVLYTEQTLTEEQKTQARVNIGAQFFITPEMYGAKGDGTTDDSVAITSAISAAIAEATNAYYLKPIVYLSAKTYKINTGIVLDSRCLQFVCDGVLLYGGTGKAISIKHSLMNVYINQIQAPNGTALYLSGEEHQCVTNNITINSIENSVIGIHLYNGGEAQSVFYNRLNVGPVNSTETCVFIETQKGYINENHFWLGKLSGASTGIKIYRNLNASSTDCSGNRFFKGSFENLKDNTENTRAIWLENTGDNVFRNFRAEENHGGRNVVFKGECQGNDIWLSFCALGGVDISGLTSGRNNYLRGKVATGLPYAGGYNGGDHARVDYGLGITYDPKFANVWAQVNSSNFTDGIIRQVTTEGLKIPTTIDFDSTANGKTYTLGDIYSEYGSLSRGFPVTFVFGSGVGEILLKDSRNGIILDNTNGKFSGKTVVVKWDGFDKVSNKNIWAVTVSGATVEYEKISNKTNLISSVSTDEQYPTAKAVYQALENVEGKVPTFDIDENGHLVILPDSAYTNLVSTAIDADGSIYNGVGFADGYRISSSGEIKAQSGTVLTGFIPCSGINDDTVIRMKGVEFDVEAILHTGIAFYDNNFNILCCARFPDGTMINQAVQDLIYPGADAGTSSAMGSDGITVVDINFSEYVLANNPISYMRVFAKGSGANMVVTIDEEIKNYDTKDVGKVVPTKGVDYYTENDKNEIVSIVSEQFPIIATEPDESIYVLENTDIDTTLSVSGKVADAKAVGNAIANITITETDPTVPSWAKASSKPSYTKSEIGLGNVDNVKQYSASNPPPYPVTKVNGKTGAVTLDAAAVGAVSTSKTLTLTGIDTDGVSHTYTIYGIEQ